MLRLRISNERRGRCGTDSPGLPALSYLSTETGFSLIEILIALVIGLVSTLAIMQLFSLSAGQKAAISGSGDAQTNGALALYSLERDIRQAGYGASALNLLGCRLQVTTSSGATLTLSALAPVTINHPDIPAGDTNTDTLLVMYGSDNGTAEGDGILAPSTSPSYTVKAPTAFAVNDRVIALPVTRPSPCSLVLGRVYGKSNNFPNVTGWASGMINGTLFNLGQAPRILAYAIRGGNLTVCDFLTNNCGDTNASGDSTFWVPIVNGIVGLRAQYGRDTSTTMDGVVDRYDQSVASPTTTPAVSSVQCGWARVSAVRIALAARAGQRATTAVTATAPTWAGSTASAGNSTTPASVATPFNLSALTDWQHYRYKVFETVVPIRNIILLGVQTGC